MARAATRGNDFWAAIGAATLGTIGAGALYYFALERQMVADALFLREVVPTAHERSLLVAALIGKTALLGTVPGMTFAILHTRRRAGAARLAYAISLMLCFLFMLADLRIFLLHGRHLHQILAFVRMPEGQQAGGNAVVWLARLAAWALQAAGVSALGLAITAGTLRQFTRIRSILLRATCATFLLLVATATTPLVLGPGGGWRTPGMQARVLGVLPLSFGVDSIVRVQNLSDPVQAELQTRLNEVYRRKFSYVFRKRATNHPEGARTGPTPNVFLILVESLRADAATPELMPEFYTWSRAGVTRSEHYSGTNFSESGAFAIMYGLNPLVYHAVLDSRVPPPLCDGLRRRGYRCAYYTGHPTVWWRREEFLGPATFDVHVRVQQGPWSEWDQRSLNYLAGLASTNSDSPYLGISFLMSTHYEYRYPKDFERHLPADEPQVTWSAANARGDFTPLVNRYKNAVGFVDHLIGQAVKNIDTERDYVIVTGDHAEALGENGRIGHGYDFSRTLLHVPLALRGPGIRPRELTGLSLHQDIWPTVRSLVSGAEPGEHDLRHDSKRRGALFAHCEFDQAEADALLLEGEVRVRLQLDLRSPELSIRGFENAMGRPIDSPRLSTDQIVELGTAFERYLDEAAQPVLD